MPTPFPMPPHELLQAAAAALRVPEMSPLTTWIFGVLQTAILGVLSFGVRVVLRISKKQDAQQRSLASLEQDVYGRNRTNGLRGDVSGLKRGFSRHDRELEVLCNKAEVDRVGDP